jgi:hypothetical protein
LKRESPLHTRLPAAAIKYHENHSKHSSNQY